MRRCWAVGRMTWAEQCMRTEALRYRYMGRCVQGIQLTACFSTVLQVASTMMLRLAIDVFPLGTPFTVSSLSHSAGRADPYSPFASPARGLP